jgi:hypothetical protein
MYINTAKKLTFLTFRLQEAIKRCSKIDLQVSFLTCRDDLPLRSLIRTAVTPSRTRRLSTISAHGRALKHAQLVGHRDIAVRFQQFRLTVEH